MKGYYAVGTLYSKGEIDSKIQEIETGYTEAISKALEDALKNNGEVNGVIAEAIAKAQKTLQDQIDALRTDVNELIGRIQSLVCVPDYDNGKVAVEGYTVNGSYLSERVVNMTFRVAPASLAAGMELLTCDEQIRLLVREVKAAPLSVAQGMSARIRKVKAGDNGEFTVQAVLDGELSKDGVALALYICDRQKAAGGKPEDAVYNDRTTDYVQAMVLPANELKDRFALVDDMGKTLEENEGYDSRTKSLNYEVSWEDHDANKDARILLGGYELRVKIDDEYRTLPEAAALMGIDAIDFSYLSASEYRTGDDVKVTDKNKQYVAVANAKDYTAISAAMNKPAQIMKEHVGEYMLVHHTFTVAGCKVIDRMATRYIVSNTKDVITVAPVEQLWSYDLYLQQQQAGDNTISFPEVKVSSNTVSLFDVLKGGEFKECEIRFTDAATGKVEQVSTTDVYISIQPKTSTAVQEITGLAINGNYKWNGTYEVEYVYAVGSTDVHVTAAVTLGPKPEEAEVDFTAVPEDVLEFRSTDIKKNVVALTGLLEKIGASIQAGDFFKKGQLAQALIDNGNVLEERYVRNAGQKDETSLTNSGLLKVDADGLMALFPKANVEAAGDRFEYQIIMLTDFGMKVSIRYAAQVKMPEYSLEAGIRLDENLVNHANASFKEGKWVIDNIDLSKDFFRIKSVSEIDPAARIVYTVKTRETAAVQNVPAVVNDIVTWGDYNQTQLALEAQIVMEGIRIGAPVAFRIEIDDPLPNNLIANELITYMKGETGARSVKVWSGLSIKDFYGKEMIDAKADEWAKVYATIGTGAEAHTIKAYGAGDPLFGEATYNKLAALEGVTFDSATGVVTMAANDGGLMQEVVVEIPVKISYRYGADKTATIVVRFSPDAR